MKSNVLGSIFHSLSSAISNKDVPQKNLNQGQVINGKVLNIYPNNHAMVRLAGISYIAQMEIPLDVDSSYLFQVETVGQPIKLKMISPIREQGHFSFLEKLGLPNHSFLRNLTLQLIKENIPFDRNILIQALKWTNEIEDSQKASQIIVKMLREQWPIKQEIFEAFYVLEKEGKKASHSFLSVLEEHIDSYPMEKKESVSHLMNQLGMSQTSPPSQLISESRSQHQEIWTRLVSKMSIQLLNLDPPIDEKNITTLVSKLQFIVSKQLGFDQNEINYYQQTLKRLEKIDYSSTKWRSEVSSLLIHPSFQKLLKASSPFLSLAEKDTVSSIIHLVEQKNNQRLSSFLLSKENSMRLKDVFSSIQLLLSQQLDAEETRIVMPLLANLPLNENDVTAKDFFVRIKNYLQLSGIDFEQAVQKSETGQIPETIKSALLSLSAFETSDHVKKALQIFTGLQLLFQTENHHQIQWNFLFPGYVFQLPSDAFVQISGRKNKEKEIDADHCFILFYLELENMRETIIHMEVQDRRVQVLIYNQNEHIMNIVQEIKGNLKQGLEALGYHLTQVKVMSLAKNTPNTSRLDAYSNSYPTGVDFTV
ncbi:hypothetical protein RZN25_00485 [Bacillaceae bacterium S4-13-56]